LGLRQMVSDHKSIVAGVGRTDNFLVLAKDYTEILASAIYILMQYVKLLVFPHPLSSDYSYAQIELKSFGDISVLLGLILFAGATIYSIIMICKKNIYAYSILFFLITIFPVSNIPFLFGSSMAERFLYIPSLGFCLLLTLLISKFTNTVIKNDRSFSFARFYENYSILLMVTATVVCLYSIKAFSRSRDWRDNLALFGAAVKTSPNSAKAHYGYGSALFNSALGNEGTPAEVAEKFELSKKEYEKALSIFPGYWNTHVGLGLYYKNKNDFKNSAIYFEQARNYSPTLSANIYKELGYAYLKSGQFDRSVAALDSCILLGMTTANIYNFKGSALFSLQKYNEALSAYLIGEKADPADIDILKNIAKCYVNLREYDKAISYFKRCVEAQPTNIENKQLLGSVYQMAGDTANAKALFR
jgi:protein O-mannosyl-transferase